MTISWDSWRGSTNTGYIPVEQAALLIKDLLKIGQWKMSLHCFQTADEEACYHTHPAWAFRIVLWGGYTEELENGKRRWWFPLRFGFVAPSLSHRIHKLFFKKSYSLWIRGAKKHEIKLRGNGWPTNN